MRRFLLATLVGAIVMASGAAFAVQPTTTTQTKSLSTASPTTLTLIAGDLYTIDVSWYGLGGSIWNLYDLNKTSAILGGGSFSPKTFGSSSSEKVSAVTFKATVPDLTTFTYAFAGSSPANTKITESKITGLFAAVPGPIAGGGLFGVVAALGLAVLGRRRLKSS